MENYVKKAMVGLSVLGNLTPFNAAQILLGNYDLELKAGLNFSKDLPDPKEEEDLNNTVVLEHLEKIKAHIRHSIQVMFNEEAEQVKKDKYQTFRKQMVENTKPHAEGTIAEIATKYGISKSEVRRLKTEGILDSFIDEQKKAKT